MQHGLWNKFVVLFLTQGNCIFNQTDRKTTYKVFCRCGTLILEPNALHLLFQQHRKFKQASGSNKLGQNNQAGGFNL